jgi:MFS family permease
MSDRYGWRSAFLIQIPVLFISFFLVWRNVHIPLADSKQTLRQKMARIDFLGSATLVGTVASLLVSLTLKTSADQELPWSDYRVWGLLVVSAVFGIAFILVEKYVSSEPIMPLRLITQRTPAFVAVSNFLISVLAFSVVSQTCVHFRTSLIDCVKKQLYNVPLWFSAVKRVSSSVAGSHLIPNSVCRTVASTLVRLLTGVVFKIALAAGSVAAGAYMRHTGKYYWFTITMAAFVLLSMSVIATFTPRTPQWILWVAIVPSGFGASGIITSTLIALIACVKKEDIAVATGGV